MKNVMLILGLLLLSPIIYGILAIIVVLIMKKILGINSPPRSIEFFLYPIKYAYENFIWFVPFIDWIGEVFGLK